MIERKVAIITGSGTGVGAATSLLLSKQGYNVLINYLSMPVVISPLWPVEFSPTPGSFGLSALL
jgi:hypothetical protein